MKFVSLRREGPVAVVSFDRGTAANALSIDLMRELTDVARGFEADHETAAIVLTGRAEAFCMGFDLSDAETDRLRQVSLAERRMGAMLGKRMCQAWQDLQPLTIAAIEGWCVGGGVALAVATDLRVVSDQAALYVPEAERSLNMSWGSIPRIVNLIGPARAKRLVILAEPIGADRALDWGLADEIARKGGAVEAALEMASRVAAMPPVAVRLCKQDIDAYANALAHVASHADHDLFALALGSDDAAEGIDAFLQKRPPRFTGN